ncbi:MAG: hypothetical protein ACKV2Q_17275 [Planctomycetaceae bacterium]
MDCGSLLPLSVQQPAVGPLGCVTFGSRLPKPKRQQAAAVHVDDNFEHLQQDSDLTPLRELPEFQTLLKQRPAKKP